MKLIKSLLICLTMAACAHVQSATAIEFETATAQIASWNLMGFNGIPDERLKRQAEGIAMMDAEVLALVEVNPDSVMDKLKTFLQDDFGLCYDVAILPQEAKLNIAVLFKCGITAENFRFIPGSDLDRESFRKALVVDMRVGRFDFTLIAVHLKSERGIDAQRLRDQQGMVIGQLIQDLRTADNRRDILLMGDFNMIPGQDVSNFHHLGANGTMDFLSSWDLQDRFSHILDAGRANLLDGFAITRSRSTEYIRGSLRVFPMHWSMDIGLRRFKRDISDHLPFIASFRITRDAD